jgi:SAM-dependent methyltransferase
MNSYYDGLNTKLLEAIPRNATKVLELGCANGKLGARYKQLNTSTFWVGVDVNAEAVHEASGRLDEVYQLDLDMEGLAKIGRGFDVIVIGDLLEHLKKPEALLNALYDISNSNSTLICCLPNMAHISVIERMICGDFTYDEMGLLDITHTRMFSAPSAMKIFLDSGWLPDMVNKYEAPPNNNQFLRRILEAAESLGVPTRTAFSQLALYQMIIKCEKWTMDILKQKGPMESFTVIVPVNRPWQHSLNIMRSPGLKEINAEVISVSNATSAAQAYEIGASKANNPWKIIAHQDVYFPTGSGLAIARHLGDLSSRGLTAYAVGFAGLGISNSGLVEKAGMVVDRKNLFNYLGSNQAASIDEFAVALHSNAMTPIDPQLGWHLWATDLCIQSIDSSNKYQSRIITIPIFHNSTNDYTLPKQFHESLGILFKKYPGIKKLLTLCGEFKSPNIAAGTRDVDLEAHSI